MIRDTYYTIHIANIKGRKMRKFSFDIIEENEESVKI